MGEKAADLASRDDRRRKERRLGRTATIDLRTTRRKATSGPRMMGIRGVPLQHLGERAEARRGG